MESRETEVQNITYRRRKWGVHRR